MNKAANRNIAASQFKVGLFGRCLYWACRSFGRLFSKLVLRPEAVGRKNIPSRGNVILASNHRSYVDPVLLGFCIARPVHFVAKAELFSNRLFGWLIRNLNAFPVRRAGADREMLRQAIEILGSGRALLLFPEGTRCKTDGFLPARPGVGLIAARTGSPVIPTYIHNSDRILPPGAKMIRFRKLYVCFGEPMAPPAVSVGEAAAEVYSEFAQEVMDRIARLKDELMLSTGQSREGGT